MGYLVQRVGGFLVPHWAHYFIVGRWGSRTHKPLGCKQDKSPCGGPVIPSVAILGGGEVYLRGGPILLHGWPEGHSNQEEGMSEKYHRLWRLATSTVQLGTINRWARED